MFVHLGRYLFALLLLLAAGCAAQGIYHTVRPGETMSAIARTYGRDEVELARINGIESADELRRGDRLFIPGATTVKTIKTASAKPVTRTELERNFPQEHPSKKQSGQPTQKTLRQAPERTMPLPVAKPEPERFAWPLRGDLVRRFGDKKPFPCKGLEIAAPSGTPVLAAAAGRVIYSDDGIRSFGHMIIVKHDDDYFTVYAFNQRNLVKSGDYVSRGEKIALSGTPPSRDRSCLYFEVRHRKEPVDPTFYLP